MNAITETNPEAGVSHATLEHVLATGDLSKLSAQQSLEYYRAVCRSVGLNPLTRPFRFMVLNGQKQLYATRDCADQLRSLHKISVELVDKKIADGLFMVTARATRPDGRRDEDMGAVPLDKQAGEFRANSILKCVTKAKRRVTLSICGLGLLDESELSSVAGARTLPDDPLLEQQTAEPTDKPAPSVDAGGNGDALPVGGEPDPALLRRVEQEQQERRQMAALKWCQQAVRRFEAALNDADLAQLDARHVARYEALKAYPTVLAAYDRARNEAWERVAPDAPDVVERIAEGGADRLSAG